MSKNNKKRIVLLDSHAILHRAYHALPEFTSATTGEPTGALYGLSMMLLKIINELKPNYIVACYDFPTPTHRHDVYEGYKANRPKTDDELVKQIKKSKSIFEAFNIPVYEKEGFEADDLLGTIADKLKNEKGNEVIIASGDMDTLQLVDGENVRVYTLKKGIKDTVIYDEKAVFKRFGFDPKSLPDYKGLRGDPSDNIIGIKGIGDKTASILIQKFGTIESLYKTLKKDEKEFEKIGITKRVKKLLEEGKEEAIFSKILATIRMDAIKKFDLPETEWMESLDLEKVKKLFGELGFRSLWQRVSEMFKEKIPTSVSAPMLEQNRPSLNRHLFSSSPTITTNEEKSYKQAENEDIKKTGLALWLVDSNMTNPSTEEIFNFSGTTNFDKAKKIIFEKLKKDGLEKIYKEIELPLLPIVQEMKERGIKINAEYFKKLSKEIHTDLEKLEKEIWKKAGVEFNINSPKQMGEILFDKMGIKAKGMKKTPTGAFSTKESELIKLQGVNEIIDYILKYRELQKLLSTYIDNIPQMIGDDNRLHANFIQSGTTTGRISSTEPNLQNIPIRTELGNAVRSGFISKKGYKLVSFDYSQIELKIVAILSNDRNLIDVFNKGEDVHSAVASKVFNVSKSEVTKEMRRRAKIINFGILYGMGINSLKKSLGVEKKEAEDFYQNYFDNFSGVAKYIQDTKNKVFRTGYTETLFGRRRYFRDIKSRLPYIKAAAERMAINAPIQGTSADIIKIAMVKSEKYLKEKNFQDDCNLLLQIHDELVYEIKEDLVREIYPEIKKIMENVISQEKTHGIKLGVDVFVGDNWGEMKKIIK